MLRGVPVYVSPVALLFAVIVAASAAPGYRNRLPELSDTGLQALAISLAILFLISLLLHELGHCFTALAMSLQVDAVTLYGFAGFTEIRPEPPTPFREFLVAVSGPVVNLVLGALAFASARAPSVTTASPARCCSTSAGSTSRSASSTCSRACRSTAAG